MTITEQTTASAKCIEGSCEYTSVMKRLPLEDQLKIFSLDQVVFYGEPEILEWCRKVEAILGFKAGDIKYKIAKHETRYAVSYYYRKIVHLGISVRLGTIVHELTHIICSAETTKIHNGRRSIHNAAFTAYLRLAVDNLVEHAEELGIKIYTAREVIREDF